MARAHLKAGLCKRAHPHMTGHANCNCMQLHEQRPQQTRQQHSRAQHSSTSGSGHAPAASVWIPPPIVLPVWLCRAAGQPASGAGLLAQSGPAGPTPTSPGRRAEGRTAYTQQEAAIHGTRQRHGSQGRQAASSHRLALTWKPRPRALTTPVVSVRSNPNGLPMARQACPTRTPAESPSGTGRSREAGALTLSTARSRALSAPAGRGWLVGCDGELGFMPCRRLRGVRGLCLGNQEQGM